MTLQPPSEHPHGLSRRGLRRALHARQADHLRLPRLSVADPPAHLSAHEPRQPARARLQGGGHHHDAVRHDGAERSRSLPPRRDVIDRVPDARRARRTLKQRAATTSCIEHKQYIASTAKTCRRSATGAGGFFFYIYIYIKKKGSAGAMLGRPAGLRQVARRIDERHVRQRLRKIAEHASFSRVVLLREQADVIAESDQTLEQCFRVGPASAEAKGVGEPERAGEEQPFSGR